MTTVQITGHPAPWPLLDLDVGLGLLDRQTADLDAALVSPVSSLIEVVLRLVDPDLRLVNRRLGVVDGSLGVVAPVDRREQVVLRVQKIEAGLQRQVLDAALLDSQRDRGRAGHEESHEKEWSALHCVTLAEKLP